jgi:hypothetical protein
VSHVIIVTGWAEWKKEWKKQLKIKISSENWAALGYYAASSGNFLPTFRDNLSVPTSGVKNSRYDTIFPKRRDGITTTGRLITQKSAVLIYLAAEG